MRKLMIYSWNCFLIPLYIDAHKLSHIFHIGSKFWGTNFSCCACRAQWCSSLLQLHGATTLICHLMHRLLAVDVCIFALRFIGFRSGHAGEALAECWEGRALSTVTHPHLTGNTSPWKHGRVCLVLATLFKACTGSKWKSAQAASAASQPCNNGYHLSPSSTGVSVQLITCNIARIRQKIVLTQEKVLLEIMLTKSIRKNGWGSEDAVGHLVLQWM